MEFVLLRHAQPSWYTDGTGEDEPSLTPLGQAQARLAAKALVDDRTDAVWCSPLRRARETAEPLVEALGLTPSTCDFLEEVHSLPVTGKTQEEVNAYYRQVTSRPVADWWAGYAGTEPLTGFIARVEQGMTAQLADLGATPVDDDGERLWCGLNRDSRIVIVAHAGTLGTVISFLLGVPQAPWAWRRFGLSHAGYARVTSFGVAGARAFGLRAFDDLTHLPNEQRTR
ncbi:MAG: putative phosphoglycerate mutase [Myxococcota bacterium]|jgi:probable phosphoglycerate mutase